MESTIITLDATTETYWDIRNLIFDTVWKFQQQYGGDFDEMVAEANLIFIKYFLSHNSDTSQFSTWLHFGLWKGLIDFKRFIREQNKYTIIKHLEEIENFYEYPVVQEYRTWELLFDLGEDAKIIVQLILNLPDDLQKTIIAQKESQTLSKRKLMIHLASLLGWSYGRIKESFQEITAILND